MIRIGSNLNTTLIQLALVLLLSLLFISKCYAVEIVVNKNVPEDDLSLADIRAIFAMRQRYWPNGNKIHVFVLPDNHSLHRKFTKTRLNMFPHQFRRIWDRAIFSGTGTAPSIVHSEQEMIDKLSTTPDSIGYSDTKLQEKNIRVLEYE